MAGRNNNSQQVDLAPIDYNQIKEQVFVPSYEYGPPGGFVRQQSADAIVLSEKANPTMVTQQTPYTLNADRLRNAKNECPDLKLPAIKGNTNDAQYNLMGRLNRDSATATNSQSTAQLRSNSIMGAGNRHGNSQSALKQYGAIRNRFPLPTNGPGERRHYYDGFQALAYQNQAFGGPPMPYR